MTGPRVLVRSFAATLAAALTALAVLAAGGAASAEPVALHRIQFHTAPTYQVTYGAGGRPGKALHLSGSGYLHPPGEVNFWTLRVDGQFIDSGSFGTFFAAPAWPFAYPRRSHSVEVRVFSTFGMQVRRWTVKPG